MVVITLEKCPISLRGDLTMWLQEISAGVYVGQVSARVRERLWQRVCEESKSGRATMVYSAQNEQHLRFEVHNAVWEPIDFDGLKLMLRPSPARLESRTLKSSRKTTPRFRGPARRHHTNAIRLPKDYVVVDVETTGLDPSVDSIIEIGALRISAEEETDRFQTFVKTDVRLGDDIKRLTGISEEDLAGGMDLEEALDQLLDFVEYDPIVMHNSSFDLAFIEAAMAACDIEEIENEVVDTLQLARKCMPNMSSHKLEDLARYFGIEVGKVHRALDDCETTRAVFVYLVVAG